MKVKLTPAAMSISKCTIKTFNLLKLFFSLYGWKSHLVVAAMRGHPAYYSGGPALQNVIPQGFLNSEM